jgi:hypothetical protein
MSYEEPPRVVDRTQFCLVMYEQRRVSPRRQRDGPALQPTGDEERAGGLALREAMRTTGPHKHRAICLANDFYSMAIHSLQKVTEAYEICEIRRTSGDVSVIACRKGPDGSSRMPRLVMPRLLYAESP